MTQQQIAANSTRGELTDDKRRNLQLTSIAVSLLKGREYAPWELNTYVLPLVRMLTRLTRHTHVDLVRSVTDDICEVLSMNLHAFGGDLRKLLSEDFSEQVGALQTVILERLKAIPEILDDITDVAIPKSRYPALFNLFKETHKIEIPAMLLIFGYFSEVLESDRIREGEKVIVVMDLAKGIKHHGTKITNI